MTLASIKTIFPPVLTPKKICINFASNNLSLEEPPKPKLTASSVLGSLKTHEYKVVDKDINFEIIYHSYIDRLEVFVSYDSIVSINVTSKDEEPIDIQITEVRASLFDTYIPTLGYTQKTKRSVSLIKAYANKNIFPLLVIGTDTKFESYVQDDFKDKHFLDLSLLHLTSNQEIRDAVESRNVGKKREDKEKLPKKEYEKTKTWEDVAKFYNLIKDKKHVIPTARITLSKSASITYAKAMTQLFENFNKLALRIDIKDKKIENLKSYLLPLASKLSNIYIILEVDPQDIGKIHDELTEIKSIASELQVILLSENIYDRNGIQDNKDIYTSNQSLVAFKNLQNYHENLIYSDYCGFEKDTSVGPTGFLARTAKIFYINPNNLDEFYIRRERTPLNTWTSAMQNLQIHIGSQKPKEIIYSHCESCKDILTKSTTFSLGDMKENCVIHNSISIAMA